MKFTNFKAYFKLVLALSFLFVGITLQSAEANKPIIKMREFVKQIQDSYADQIKKEFEKDFGDTFGNRMVNFQNPNQLSSPKPCNNLLLTGLKNGTTMIKNRIMEISPNSPIQLKRLDVKKLFSEKKESTPTEIKNYFNKIGKIANDEKSIVLVVLENVESVTKNNNINTKQTAQVNDLFLNSLISLNEGIDSVKENSRVFVFAISNDPAEQLDNTFVKRFNYPTDYNIIQIGQPELTLLSRYFEIYNLKPNVSKIEKIQDSLENPCFFTTPNPSELEKLQRYVKCNKLEGTTGWIPYRMHIMADKIQKIESDTAIMSNESFNAWANKALLEGPSGNGKTTMMKKIAELSGCKFEEINTAGMMKKFVNTAPNAIDKIFEAARNFTMDSRYKKIILFFDEADALFKENTSNSPHLTHHEDAAKTFWLNLDNVTKWHPRIYVVIATNKFAELPKPLVKRIGGNRIEMPNPNEHMRSIILNHYVNELTIPLSKNDIIDLAKKSDRLGLREIEASFKFARDVAVHEKLQVVPKKFIEAFIELLLKNNTDINKKEDEEKSDKELQRKLLNLNILAAEIATNPERVKRNDEIQIASLEGFDIQKGTAFGGIVGLLLAAKQTEAVTIVAIKTALVANAVPYILIGGATGAGCILLWQIGKKWYCYKSNNTTPQIRSAL